MSHFSDEAAINRIAMCEDCRVIDMFESMAADPMNQKADEDALNLTYEQIDDFL